MILEVFILVPHHSLLILVYLLNLVVLQGERCLQTVPRWIFVLHLIGTIYIVNLTVISASFSSTKYFFVLPLFCFVFVHLNFAINICFVGLDDWLVPWVCNIAPKDFITHSFEVVSCTLSLLGTLCISSSWLSDWNAFFTLMESVLFLLTNLWLSHTTFQFARSPTISPLERTLTFPF